jgi:hypothetical protein
LGEFTGNGYGGSRDDAGQIVGAKRIKKTMMKAA